MGHVVERKVKPGRLYPFGYGMAYRDKDDADEVRIALGALMSDPKTVLLDIRLHPGSRHHSYTGEELRRIYGKQYKHSKGLGNRNHKEKDKPIALADPAPGVAKIVAGLASGYSFVLLCGCVHYEKCHRRVVEELVRAEASRTGLVLEDPRTIHNGDLCRWSRMIETLGQAQVSGGYIRVDPGTVTRERKEDEVIILTPSSYNPYDFVVDPLSGGSASYADFADLEMVAAGKYRCEAQKACHGQGSRDVMYRPEWGKRVCGTCAIMSDPDEMVDPEKLAF